MEEGFISSVIVAVLNPEPVYEAMTYIASLAAFFPWLFVVVIAFRLYKESLNALSMKAAFSQALGDTTKTLVVFLAYTGGGALLFLLLFAFSDIFSNMGSIELIHQDMLELRSSLVTNAEDTKAWYETALESIADTAVIPIAALIWLIFQLLSVGYVFLSQLIDVLFALAVVALYAWGFLVIPTMTLGDEMDLTKGWKKSALTLFIWAILEPIFLGVIWLMGSAASDVIATNYAGFGYGTNAITIWYLFSILVMFIVLLFRIITPFIAMYLARNDTFVGAIAGAAAAAGALMMKQIMETAAGEDSKVRERMGELATSMAPNAEGLRHRDALARGAQSVRDIMNTPVSDVARRVSGGLGGLESSSGVDGPAADSEANSGADSSGSTSPGSSSHNDLGDSPSNTSDSSEKTGNNQSATDSQDTSNTDMQNSLSSYDEYSKRAGTESPGGSVGGAEGQNDLSASYEKSSTADSPSDPEVVGKDGK